MFHLRNIYRDTNNSEELVKIAWSYYIAKHNNKTIFIDTGFRDESVANQWGITFTGVENELGSIIKNLNLVDTIIITHSHFDHIENLDLFDKPEIIISKIDYEIALTQCSQSIKEKLLQCNVVTVENEYICNELFRFKVIGGHSNGSSVVYFESNNNNYIITGDECYWCDNMISNRPIGIYSSTENNERFINDTHPSGLIPLPFHDLKIFEQYSAISKNIVRIL
ncbi:MBL fold metallo-hydrolase [Paenibacillus endoradicis]|uniref:MBL fold metallo-hydrolase n=1 Tax=Paenibacillus endoradicis TaxID=2972487 RepID=UPI002158F93D|nr:MBL fold metallo-hydrolase [Paenibacillus endoradicis]MCR8658574.1 MBL fold metallo-hydrolase [Paenibacillus endoradicis]